MGRVKEKLNFLRDILPNQRLPVEMGPVHFGIITPMGKISSCANMLAIYHKTTTDYLTVHDWKYMPSEFIENCILEVKLNDWIKLKLNERWRNHKHTVKTDAYKKWPTNLDQRLANPPKSVDESQWRVLVDVWENDAKKKEICVKNKENRAKQKNLHTTGSKPHANYAVEIYGVTHFRKRKTADPDEVLMDREVAAEIKEMEEVKYQTSQPGGRVRCLGNAVKPKKYWGEESSSQATNEPNVEILNIRQQLEITIGDLQAAMKRISELEAQLATCDETGTANGALQEALKKMAELKAKVESLNMVNNYHEVTNLLQSSLQLVIF
ncbi:hypothetical protein MKX01_023707 [Papaver californicum]|nr:hypothetical protein MKX01_023707 [Papaver californicum]